MRYSGTHKLGCAPVHPARVAPWVAKAFSLRRLAAGEEAQRRFYGLSAVLVAGVVLAAGCRTTPAGAPTERPGYMQVTRGKPARLDARWNKRPWRKLPAGLVANAMGTPPEHRPKTEVKVAYDESAVYVIFRVEDRYVRAIQPRFTAKACLDSCVEFFFSPGPDVAEGYFNLEVTCGGAMLLGFQAAPGRKALIVPEQERQAIAVAHSLPAIVDPEITAPVTWTVEYRIPLDLLRKYRPVLAPAPGVIWRANFYKCADQTSHPHWLTWAPVDLPWPNFHTPQFFGRLEFL